MNSRRWFTRLRLLILLPLLVLLSSSIRSTAVSAAGGLTINVVNQNGQPAASATWVDIYDPAGNQQQDAGYLTNGTGIFSRVKPGTYTIVVSSMGDHFQIHTTTQIDSNTVLNLDARVGTVPVTFVAVARDGSLLRSTNFTIAPQPILAVSGSVGYGDSAGQLKATVTPGTYTVAVQDADQRMRLDLPDQGINAATTVTLNEGTLATGRITVVLDGISEGSFRPNRSPNAGTDFSLGAQSTVVISAGTLYADVELDKKDTNNKLWILGVSLPGSPFNITAATDITIHVGGTLTSKVSSLAKQARGGTAFFSTAFNDAHANKLNYVAADQDLPAMLMVTDARGQVILQQAVRLYDNLNSFTIPESAAPGMATVTLTLDTGPFQGVLSTRTQFEILQSLDRACFNQTGQCAEGRLLQYWNQNGALPVFGFPLTTQAVRYTRDGEFPSQMFERNRLELHPENTGPYDVLLGRLGADLLVKQGRPWETLPSEQPKAGCKFFEATHHNLCEPFLSYWSSHGLDLGDPGISERESLALFGYPITTPAMEKNSSGDTVMTQWFERARFEQHPENKPPYDVLLGRLGAESK